LRGENMEKVEFEKFEISDFTHFQIIDNQLYNLLNEKETKLTPKNFSLKEERSKIKTKKMHK
jgi:predicted NACHT family NTPase